MDLFDAHFHIINPEFPLVENNGYLPPTFAVQDYKKQTNALNIKYGTIVSGSFQAFDQNYLIDALEKLGKRYVGVANIPLGYDKTQLKKLVDANIVAVRFNLKRGGSEKLKHLKTLAQSLYDQWGWHTELYVDAVDLRALKSTLKQIPLFSIDHLGLSSAGLNELYYWAENGMKIKATGFGRLDFDPIPVMKKIYSINPDALMFGTDLPSTRAKTPFSTQHITKIKDAFSNEAQQKILFKNALGWYFK